MRKATLSMAIAAGLAAIAATAVVAATDPTAVWVSGEFADAASEHGGYAIATNASNTIDYYGRIVIGDDATIGATIALPSGTYSKASVLVKYELPSGGAPVANAVIAGSLDTSTHAVGAICTAKDGFALAGYWRNGSNGALTTSGYAFANSPAVSYSGGEGYLLYSYDSDSGTKIYLGTSITNLLGGASGGLKFSSKKIETISIGGPHVASTKPWAGMKIKGVALFAGAFLEPNDVKTYAFPDVTKAPPEDPERYAVEPVAVWYKDFKTTTKGSYALSVSGTTAVADDAFGSSITIGDAAAVIDTTAAASGNLTVLKPGRRQGSHHRPERDVELRGRRDTHIREHRHARIVRHDCDNERLDARGRNVHARDMDYAAAVHDNGRGLRQGRDACDGRPGIRPFRASRLWRAGDLPARGQRREAGGAQAARRLVLWRLHHRGLQCAGDGRELPHPPLPEA